MFSTAIIIFREILEIAMIIGVVLAATRGVPDRTLWVVGGFAAGCTGAGLVALFAETISASLSGMGQEFFNALILFTAALFIGWTALWIRKNARTMVAELKQVGQDVVTGKLPHYSLALIIGLALLREGSEIVLFIYGMSLSGQDAASIVVGSAVGAGAGCAVGVMLYYGLLRIPTRHVLRVTSWLLFLLVAGLASQGIGYMVAAGYFENMSQQMWNTSWLLSENSILGKSLHSLIGYTARPTLIQLIVYCVTLGGLLLAASRIDQGKKKVHVLAVAAAFIGGLFLMAMARPAFALDKIYSPNAEPHEMSLEYNGNRTFDNKDVTKNNAQEHQLSLEAGVTDRLMVEATAGFVKEPTDHIRVDHLEAEGRYQFFEQGENWMDSGLLVAYGYSTKDQTANTLEVKLLLQKDFLDKFTTMVNMGFSQQVGHYAATGGPEYAFLANTRYRYNQYFQPGIELQSSLGQGHNIRYYDQQEHYIGPAVYGKLFGRVKYQAAYLWGASQASANSAARVLVEYEWHF